MKKLLTFSTFILTLVSLSTLLRPSAVLAEDCGGPVPPKPVKVWAKPGPAGGQVTLYWDSAPHANRYAVAYGTKSNKYLYGADNIGSENARSYTVKSLASGQKYYFRLAAANGCSSSPFSDEVTATSGSGAVVEVAKAAPSQPFDSAQGKPSTPSKPAVVSKGVGQQMLWAKSGPKMGEVTLYWMNNESADNYHLVYGTEHGKFKYGALNIGKVNKFTVMKLAAGVEYHFALVPVMNNQAMYTTQQVMMRAMGAGVEVVQTTRENLIVPQPFDTTQGKPKQPVKTTTPKVSQVTPSPVISTQAPESSPSGY